MKLGFFARIGWAAVRPEVEEWLENRAVHIPEKKLVEMHTKFSKPVKSVVDAVDDLLKAAVELKVDPKVIEKVRKALVEVKPVLEDTKIWREKEVEISMTLLDNLDSLVGKVK